MKSVYNLSKQDREYLTQHPDAKVVNIPDPFYGSKQVVLRHE